jgi:hypothetical protein
MELLRPGQIRFRVHGPDTATDEVSAGVFSRQLGTLSRALRAADRAVNGRVVHDYVIASLSSTTPTALLAERPLPRYGAQLPIARSGIDAFTDCVDAVTIGDEDRAIRYADCVKQIAKFAKTGYSEVWTGESTVFRIDPFLTERAREIVQPPITRPVMLTFDQGVGRKWYKGAADGSFDGTVKAADLRGALPQIILVLTAGGVEIDCICRVEDIESIRSALDRRARVYGRAIYDGSSGLPRRIEVRKIEAVNGAPDFTRWKGAFQPFDMESEWPGDGP